MLTVTLEAGNAAFDDAPEIKTARILRKLADQIENGAGGSIPLHDFNGNKVGAAHWLPNRSEG
jgi:hypothetical protein